ALGLAGETVIIVAGHEGLPEFPLIEVVTNGGTPYLLILYCHTIKYGVPPFCSSFPSGNTGCETIGFQFGNEDFFVLARKSRGGAKATLGSPHKTAGRLTPPGQKKTVSGWKLVRSLTPQPATGNALAIHVQERIFITLDIPPGDGGLA
ncbi:MAG: hypothetical protein V2B13_12730, partial [Pseudomonadota bacterium]